MKADLPYKVNPDGWGECARCKTDVGTIGFERFGTVVCVACASDIRRGTDTRKEWWRKMEVGSQEF
jgi:hypothetical protein